MLAQAMRDEVRSDYTMDQPVERYTAADHAVWRRLFERQAETLQGRACDEFLDGLAGLGVAKEGIPSFDRLSEALTKATGWKIVAVPGLVPTRSSSPISRRADFPSPGGSASPSRWITCRSRMSSTTSTAMSRC